MTTSGGIGGHRMRSASNSDFQLEVGKGNIEGYAPVFFSGENFGLNLSEKTLWGAETFYTFPSAAGIVAVTSTSVNDTLAGTGANQVVLSGLDANYDTLVEIVDMNGTTAVNTTSSFLRVNSISVISHGSLNKNDGVIDGKIAGSDVAHLNAGEGQSRQAIQTVPRGKTWFAQGLSINTGKNDEVDIRAVAFTPSGLRLDFSRNIMFQQGFVFVNLNMIAFPEMFDVMVTGTRTAGSSAKASCVVQFLEVDNGKF